jgi:hypothetical protein
MDDWDDEDWLPWFEVGSSCELSGQEEPPRFRSVSPAAHRAFQIGKAIKAQEDAASQCVPIGLHRPVR